MIFTHIYNGEEVAITDLRQKDGIIDLHHEVYKFSKEIYYSILQDFQDIKAWIKSEGYSKIIVATNEPDEKFRKYLRMFGFFRTKAGFSNGNKIIYSLMEI